VALDFSGDSARLTLTIVAGCGPLGKAVVTRLQSLLDLLPTGAGSAIRCAESDPEKLAVVLRSIRADLTLVRTVEAIEHQGWQVEGRESGHVGVQHVIIGAFPAVAALQGQIDTVCRNNPGDPVRLVLHCDSPRRALQEWPLPELPWACQLVVPQLASGLMISEDDLASCVAGTLLLSLLPTLAPSLRPLRGTVSAFGFSGYSGLVGDSLRRLGEHVALAILDTQLAAKPVSDGTAPEPPALKEFLERWSPATLGLRLFDPRLVEELRPEPIPARPLWAEDGTLAVRLDRSALALELHRGAELGWSEHIRRASRGFDMSRAAVWRQQLAHAAGRIAREIDAEFAAGFRDLLGRLAFGPAWCGRMLETLERRIKVRRSAMTDSSADLEEALSQLDAAIAARPNALVLAIRMALLVVPALVAGSAILAALYPPGRAAIFTGTLIVVGLALGGGAVIRKVLAAHRTVLAARDRALDIALGRQETLLSHNALGYLADLTTLLRKATEQSHKDLEQATVLLGAAHLDLDGALASALAESSALAPVLVRRDEYQATRDLLDVDGGEWVAEACGAALFAGLHDDGLDRTAWRDRLLAWCTERIAADKGCRKPDYGQLWQLRARLRGQGAVTEAIETLWDRSVACTDAPQGAGSEVALFVLPSDLGADGGKTAARASAQTAKVVETTVVPLACCARLRGLDVVRRIAS